MQANIILGRAYVLLNDITNIRWPATELLGYLNDGQRQIVVYRPDASVSNATVALVAGSTKQTIPAGGIRVIDVVRNMGAGSTPGRPVILVPRDIIDSQVPTWHTDEAQETVRNFVFDPEDPTHYYVYPQPAASVHLEIIYSVPPTDCETAGNSIGLSDIYTNSLLDYIMYRAFSKDTEYADVSKAARYYNSFGLSLGVKTKVDMAMDPNNA